MHLALDWSSNSRAILVELLRALPEMEPILDLDYVPQMSIDLRDRQQYMISSWGIWSTWYRSLFALQDNDNLTLVISTTIGELSWA